MAQREAVALSVQEIIGSPYFSSAIDGLRVYESIRELILRGDHVLLSFEGYKDLTMAFLVAAVGSLYGDFDEHRIQQHLQVVDLSEGSRARLNRAISTSKTYFANPAESIKALKEDAGEYSVDLLDS